MNHFLAIFWGRQTASLRCTNRYCDDPGEFEVFLQNVDNNFVFYRDTFHKNSEPNCRLIQPLLTQLWVYG